MLYNGFNIIYNKAYGPFGGRKFMKFGAESSLIGLLCVGLMASPAYSEPPAEPASGEFPVVQGQGSLTVSGDGYWHRGTYQSGEQPVLSAYASDGQLLPDGEYRYEFRTVSASAKSSSRQQDVFRGRSENSAVTRRKSVPTVSGRFEIQGGQVIFP
jgi:hypothetical protein